MKKPAPLPKLLFLSLAAMASGCGKPTPGDRPVQPDAVTDFPTLFANNCSGCHGADGRLGPAPPLNDSLFLAIMPKEELKAVVRKGRPGTPMPAFARDQGGKLTDAQIDAILTGVLETWGKKGETKAKLPGYASVKEAPSAEQIARGGKVFAEACAHCHGEDGKGGSRAGAVNDPVFLSLCSDDRLRRTVITGRPDLGMPDFRRQEQTPRFKTLTDQDIADVASLLRSWRPVAP